MQTRGCFFSLCAFGLLTLSVQGADPTGRIAGTVFDPSGAAVQGAKITATALATGLTRETSSAIDGGFVFPLLPVGFYSVSVEAQGFRRFEQKGIQVQADQSSTVPINLEIGSTSETVSVEANAELVETRSGTLSKVVTQQSIIELPLNGRNAASLVLLAPGTADLTAGNARGSGDTQQTATYPGGQSITSNGARADDINYNLDGGSNQDHYTNVNNPFPNPDAVEEFSVQTNSYSAEYGRGAGAIVNVVTKSGTNRLHGSAFEFLRNGDLNARNFFASNHDLLKRNQFGGSLGGPIRKDRLFFFGTYQGTVLRNVSLGNTATVLTDAQRQGNFSAITSRQLVDPLNKQPFPGNIIPPGRIDPVSAKILKYIPTSPRPDALIGYDLPVRDTENQAMGRIDYNLSKQRFYGRYFYAGYTRDPVVGSVDLITSTRGFTDRDQSVSFSHVYNVRPTLLNSFIFSFNRINGTILSGAPFGFPDLGIPIAASKPPEMVVSVAGYFSVNTGHPGAFNRQNFHFADSLHWIKGRHEIAIGGDLMKMQVDLVNTFRQNGNFRFRGTGYSGDPRSDFLLGFVDRFIQGGGEYAARRGTLGSIFVQDNYRVSSSLVLNLGLRWDPFHPYSDTLGRTECYRPGLASKRFVNAPPGYLFEGDAGCPSGGSDPAYGQFGPRVGFAYNVGGKGKTTIRGGFGVFYQPPFVEAYNNMVDSAPWSPQVQIFRVPFDNPYANYPNPFPAQFAPFVPPSNVQFIIPPSLAVSYTPDWKPGRTMSWNVTVEHQLRSDLLLRVGYAASKGTHLGYNSDVNAPLPGPGATADNENDRRPNPYFQEVVQDISGANSIYNSLQVSMEKRFSHGFTASANYTFAKSIDEISYLTDLCGVNVINPYNARAYHAVSDFNVPQRFVLNYLWQLPSPQGGVTKALFGGWETAAIWNWQSGFPLNITSNDDRSLSAVGNDLADEIGPRRYTSGPLGARILKWFDTSSFTSAKLGTFGNAGRNVLIGPGTFNIDFSAHKLFTIRERWRLQYRAEFFNILNHTQLNNPDTGVIDGNFGRITGARAPRILQMALKLIF